MRPNLVAVLVILLLFVGVVPARAGLIFSNFGPGDSYDPILAIYAGSPEGYEGGVGFIPASSFTLGAIDFAAVLYLGANQIELRLMSDNAGVPGALIESFVLSGDMVVSGTVLMPPPLTAVSMLQPELEAGALYWLIAGAPNADTSAGWCINTQGSFGPRATRQSGGEWETYQNTWPAFRIWDTSETVPEPSTFVLLLAGLALLLLGRRAIPAPIGKLDQS